MKLNISINTDNNCKVVLKDNTEYISESQMGTSKGSFKYSDTISIAVIQHNKIEGAVIKQPTFGDHSSPEIVLPIEFDGWFTVNYIVLPSKEWFYKEQQKETGSALELYNLVYYSDGDHIYKYINGETTEVTLSEVLLVNSVDTTLSKTSHDYVSICFLQKCYINLCQQIFNQRGFSPCWNKNTIDSELVYKRDLVWMAINVIKYLTEFNQLAEVERIIEEINGCNGLCKSNSTNKSTGSGCGCSK